MISYKILYDEKDNFCCFLEENSDLPDGKVVNPLEVFEKLFSEKIHVYKCVVEGYTEYFLK